MLDRLAARLLKRPALTLAVATSALASIGVLLWFVIDRSIAMDFGVYWRAANEPLATVYQPRPVLNFPYPPTMLLWISPLSQLPLWPAYIAFVSLSAASAAMVCRRYLTGTEILLVLASPPVVYCVLNGQVTLALTGALLWACGTGNRIAAGAAFAAIASIKPQLVVFVPLLLLANRDWNALASSVFTFAVIVAGSLAAFGIDIWTQWLRALDHFHDIVLSNGVLHVTITPASAAEYWGFPSIPFMLAGAAAGAWLVIKCRAMSPLKQTAAVAAGSLMAAPYAIIYDLSAVMPFLAWSAFRGRVTAAVALSGALNPLPLILTAWQLAASPPTLADSR